MRIEQIRSALVLGVRGVQRRVMCGRWKEVGDGVEDNMSLTLGAGGKLRRPDSCLGQSERGLGLGGKREGGPRTEP